MLPTSNVVARLIVALRYPLLVAGLVVAVLAWRPAGQLDFDRSLENMFAPGDPLLVPYLQLKRTFGGNEVVMVVYRDEHLGMVVNLLDE